MHQLKLQEAEQRLAELTDEAASGQKVVITREDGLAFQIVPLAKKPRFGSAKGLIKIADDFDEPLEDFEPYGP